MTDWTAIREALSAARLAQYQDRCGNDIERTLKLYAWNAELAAAFQMPLGQLEVVVRNALHDALAVRAGTDRWWEYSRIGVQVREIKEVGEVVQRLARLRLRAQVTADDVVPELTFWVRLLDKRHEDVWRQVLRDAFPHLPSAAKRADLQRELDHLRRFRNRVAHLEPIYHRDLAADYDTILRCIAFVSPPTAIWVDDMSRVVEVIQQRPVLS